MHRFTITKHTDTHRPLSVECAKNKNKIQYVLFNVNANRFEWNQLNEWLVFATKNACMHLTHNTKPRIASISILNFSWFVRDSHSAIGCFLVICVCCLLVWRRRRRVRERIYWKCHVFFFSSVHSSVWGTTSSSHRRLSHRTEMNSDDLKAWTSALQPLAAI